MTQKKITIIAVSVVLAVAFFSTMATVIFAMWQGYDLDRIRPWHWFEYVYYFKDIRSLQMPLFVSGFVPAVLVLIVSIGPRYKPKDLFGDARWSKTDERRKAGLNDASGILLGKSDGKFLSSDTATHVLLTGPTRAGKGTGVVVPNCLNWGGSLVVLDVKTENYKITSGFRHSFGHQTFLWSPMAKDGKSHRFNPLDMVSKHAAHRVTDVQNIATMLVHVSEKDPMWGEEARALFVGLTLYVIEKDKTKSLGQVYRWLCSAGDLRETCEALVIENPDLSSTCLQNLQSYAGKNPKEAASVRSNLTAALRLFANPVVDAATEVSDFSIKDLRRKRMAVYVGAMASQLDTLAPLLRLFFQQCMAVMSEKEPGDDEPHKVLMLLDEFVSLGRMDAIVSAFTLLAGYNVRVMAVIQGLSWLDNNYGRDVREGLISCCGHQIFMTTNDETTTAYVSNALGEKTVTTQSMSKRSMNLSTNSSSPSRNLSTTARPLMSKDDVRRMDRAKQVILTEGHRPTLADKITFYDDRYFKKRLLAPAPVPSLDLDMDKRMAEMDLKVQATVATLAERESPNNLSSSYDDNYESADRANDDVPDRPLSAVENETYAVVRNELLEILRVESENNPRFKASQGSNIAVIADADRQAAPG